MSKLTLCLNVSSQNTKQKVVAMETQYKLAARSAQLLAKDAPQDEAARVMATMATSKSQLSKVRERCPSLVRECHVLLPLLEEMEKHITAFYQALERASRITSADREADTQTQQKQKWQDLLNQQQSCKRCLSVIERNHHALQRALSSSKVLRNFDLSLLQKRVSEIQNSTQALLKEVGEWRRQEEANNCLRRRFEESRQELERVLKKAQGCLRETGDAEELLKKHSDFFGQLDQRLLSVFLKACDELTDILPQEEQQGLQETVRRLHKHWKDIQSEVPSHLLRLKVEVEWSRVAVIIKDCRSELDREMQALSGTCTSERVIKEHRLPDNDPVYRTLDSTRRTVEEVTEQIKSTYLKLEHHPDKWKSGMIVRGAEGGVCGALEEVLRVRREAEEQISSILDAEGLEEAKQLYLIHQREAELLVAHCRQLQKGEGLSQSLHQLEGAFRDVDHKSGAKEHNLQELLTKVEECSVRADLLLEKAADIQLGPKNQTLLLQHAQTTREAVAQLQDHLNKNVVQVEMMCMWWERFSSESEGFSQWINETEKELEAVSSTSSLDPLDKHIITVEHSSAVASLQAVADGLEERRAALAHMEADCEALSRFVTPGEAGRIRTRLAQMRRCWEELKGRAEQLGGQLIQRLLLAEIQ
ncbi:hypothetical protein F7725_019632 [Dissostichus mawsoni]|uniref:Nesprin-1 n=1 Tax=Dissostichus mawsoni TaxID=36200 RepID=A0A7J5YL82_DISMA|nr:hypothetical protein F7725_019632 [Dissostichus mawsoni]